jgi:hypothetical protein
VAERVEEGLLRSLEQARISRQGPNDSDAFGDQLRRGLKLPVEPVLPHSGSVELLIEPVLPPVGAILPSGN